MFAYMTEPPEPRHPGLTGTEDNATESDDPVARAFLKAMTNFTPGSQPPMTMWWSLSKPDGGGTHMRVTSDGGRWQITDVYIHGPALTATDLQAVPTTQLDLIMNLVGDWDPDTIAEAHNDIGQQVIGDPEDEPTLAELRELAIDAPPELPRTPTDERPRLTRPDGTDPDGFAAQVAAAYREYVQTTRSPAVEIAKEAGVPVGTVRGWIREARRRGKLPEGRKGKAG